MNPNEALMNGGHMTTRMKLHALADKLEDAAQLLHTAQQQYKAARDAYNTLVDKLCPLPNGEPAETIPADGHFDGKVALVKLIVDSGRNPMGVAIAKQAVDQWQAKRHATMTDGG